jgi:glycosyltransferase involved in cell wall biosynthesis
MLFQSFLFLLLTFGFPQYFATVYAPDVGPDSYTFLEDVSVSYPDQPKKQTICLNMIVKDEAPIIRRCLDSVKHLIDYWVIVDTGSSDGTQKVIKNYMKDIPGELHERPWKNWGETRSLAFNLAKDKADYILFMDADDVLEFDGDAELPFLTEDQYMMWRGTDTFSYLKPQIVRGDLPWKWTGVTHEYLECDEANTSQILDNVHYTSIDDGATRHDPNKYKKNIELLEVGLKEEPENVRYVFYLAESYRDFGDKANALKWYQKRVQMGGWEEEIFWSKVKIGNLLHELGLSDNIVIEAYKDALSYRPHRAEPYYYLAELFNSRCEYAKAYEYLRAYQFVLQPESKDVLFNVDWIQEYGLLFQKSISAYYVGNYDEALRACDQLIANKSLPDSWRELACSNREYPLKKLGEKKSE